MGFLDKVQQAIDKGQDKIGDLQAKRSSDQLLRDLGAWYYAERTGRDGGDGAGHVERLVGELQAFEAANGPLGGDTTADPAAPGSPASAAVIPDGGPPPGADAPGGPWADPAAAPPPPPFSTSPPPPPAAPMPPAEPAAPVTPGPPPPPPTSGPPPPPAPGA